MDSQLEYTVLLTGFGPFGNHVVNASWEAVEELKKLCSNSMELQNVKVVAKQIPVCYEYTSTHIPILWAKHSPIVALHTGVSHKAKCLTLEYRAHSRGYVRSDIYNKCPNETDVSPTVLESKVDVEKIYDLINERSNETGCTACISDDAGRYLCEYIFYQSLRIEPTKTLFVHVPDLHTYSSAQTAKGLYDILCYMIENQINEKFHKSV